MAISIATATWKLTNVGIALGDIVTLAGWGRSTISWLTTNARDEEFLKLWNLDIHELDLRKGLIDPTTLNARWGEQVELLQNGRIIKADVSVENMNPFTWIMTILTCCLDVVVSNLVLKELVVILLGKILEDKSTGDLNYYISRSINEHIDGWRSAACARGMSRKARIKWSDLEKRKYHLPGFIPSNDRSELIRFLRWLIITKENCFLTASSDIFALAMLLQDVGLDMIRTLEAGAPFDESVAAVIFDPALLSTQNQKSILESNRYRKGMRIPLESLSEIVSLWPGSTDSNNRRRKILADGLLAASDLDIKACSSPWGNRDLGIAMQITSRQAVPLVRVETPLFELGNRYLLLNTNHALERLKDLVDSWGILNHEERTSVVQGLGLVGRRGQDFEYHADLQIFLLGYYYAALSPILDTSQLSVQEAFGSWGWNDLQFFDLVTNLKKTKLQSHTVRGSLYWRYQVLKVVAYLFAGAHEDQVSQIQSEVVGVVGKIAVLSGSLIGDADTPSKVTRFVLMELDPASIPKNRQGLVLAGKQPRCTIESSGEQQFSSSISSGSPPQGQDYTSHIEPDWDYDVNHCLVTFRYQGRIVHRISPSEAEAAVLEWYPATRELATSASVAPEATGISSTSTAGSTSFRPALLAEMKLKEFQEYNHRRHDLSGLDLINWSLAFTRTTETVEVEGQHIRWVRDAVTIVDSEGLPKARTCILTMYADHYADKIVTFKGFPWPKYFGDCIAFETKNGGLILLI